MEFMWRHVSCLLLAVLLCVPAARADEQKSPVLGPEQVYAETCHFCHDTGVGHVIKGMHVPAGQIEMIVRHGFGPMPAFTPTAITDPELQRLVQYLSKMDADGNKVGGHP
jgi:cytochrome c5